MILDYTEVVYTLSSAIAAAGIQEELKRDLPHIEFRIDPEAIEWAKRWSIDPKNSVITCAPKEVN